MAQIETQLSGIVESTVVDTFHGMLGQNVFASPGVASSETGHKICTRLMLNEEESNKTHENPNQRLDEEADADFCFSFDQELLEKAAAGFYPAEQLKDPQVVEDIACAIVNIVGSRIKSFLNKNGYNFSMGLPFVEQPGVIHVPRQGAIHIHFSSDSAGNRHDDSLVVDLMVDNKKTGTGN